MFKYFNNLRSKISFGNSKKGIIALDALIGTILSVLALLLVFQVFSNAFLQIPDNLKIAEANAKSIVEFVDYSKYSDDLSKYTDCFTMMKLKNLENFQFKDDKGNNYVYIIDNEGVYILKNSEYELYSQNKKKL